MVVSEGGQESADDFVGSRLDARGPDPGSTLPPAAGNPTSANVSSASPSSAAGREMPSKADWVTLPPVLAQRPCCVGWTPAGLMKLADAYRLAISTPLLVLAVLGCIVLPVGWRLLDWIVLPDQTVQAEWRGDSELFRSWPGQRTLLSRPRLADGVSDARRHDANRGEANSEANAAAARSAAAEVLDETLAATSADGSAQLIPTPDSPSARNLATPRNLAETGSTAEKKPPNAEPAVVELRESQPFSWLPFRSVRGFPEDPVATVPYRLVKPAWRIFDRGLSWRVWIYFTLGALWTVAVWALFGGAICRMAVVRLGRDERVGFRESLHFARAKWHEFWIGPLLPLLGLLLMAIPMWAMGLAMRTQWGLILGGLAFPLMIVSGLLMAILALGLLAGWPLMWGVVAGEGSDSFDAISSSYAFVMQRPLTWASYVLAAAASAFAGWLITTIFCEAVLSASFWGVAVGMGDLRAAEVARYLEGQPAGPWAERAGIWLVAAWFDAVRLVASSVAYAHFWSLATVVYLLLRKDLDDKEWAEVYLEDEAEERFGLPAKESVRPAERAAVAEAEGASSDGGDGHG